MNFIYMVIESDTTSNMNSIIFLYTVCLLCVVQAQDRLELFSEAESLKNSIDAISDDLATFGRNFIFTYHVELSKQKIENHESAEYALTVTLDKLKSDTKAYMVQGKDVSHCYESAEKYVDTKSKVVFKALDKCVENESPIIDSVSAEIRYHMQGEGTIRDYLNDIVRYCSSGTPVQVTSCISSTMPTVKRIVVKHQFPVAALKDRALSLMYAGVENYYDCADPVMDTFYNELHEVKNSHEECMNNVN